MITLQISCTARSPHHTSRWETYNQYDQHFEDMNQAHAWLKKEYYYCKKRVPCYLGLKDGRTIKSGYIYCYKGMEYLSTGDRKTVYYQDWITFHEEKPIEV